MAKKLYISDLHLFHNNVTKAGRDFDGRPYENLEQMHDDIMQRWNKEVTNGDHVYVLGDMVWKFNAGNREEVMRILKGLNGNLHLITGNHDNMVDNPEFKKRFAEITNYKRLKDTVNGKERTLILSHYYMPFYEGHLKGNILLHGHSHFTKEALLEMRMSEELNKAGYPCEAYNVGCMYPYMGYAPRTLQHIVDEFPKWRKMQ